MSSIDSVPVSGARTGHCLCGSVGYRFDVEPEAVILCHCGHCRRHSGAAFTTIHERPDLVIVKAGTLDDSAGLKPSAEVWWRRAQDWIEPTRTGRGSTATRGDASVELASAGAPTARSAYELHGG
ncbi:hypothetical protein ABZ814_21570 [Micromonospora musae]|uniref:GFA family protein n=1 Tax=Micromonospora musae TaxID=1894970 RepID=UPI0033D3C2E4